MGVNPLRAPQSLLRTCGVEWFGCRLHPLVDVKHEVARSHEITHTKAGDGETPPVVLEQAQVCLTKSRTETPAYDRDEPIVQRKTAYIGYESQRHAAVAR